MVDNDQVNDILANAESIIDNLNQFYLPVSEGDKVVNGDNISAALVQTWEALHEHVFDVIEETEIVWSAQQELDDSDDEVQTLD